jgi:1,4-dihydroxy-2-naphthoate octaprenyltransferase
MGVLSVRPLPLAPFRALLALVVALALQIGTNYANDYSDGVKGTDEERVGPFRLTASRLVPATSVRRAAFLSFGVAASAGLILSALTSWWLVPLGISAVLAGWFYTGGPRPYGYYGWGEFFVFVYFGLLATVGSAYVQCHVIPTRAWWLGVAAGAMACILLEANNMRDIEGDRAVGKKTLAARLGRRRAPLLVAAFFAVTVVGVAGAHQVLAVATAIVLYSPVLRRALSRDSGRALLPMLRDAARAQLLTGVSVALVLVLHP